VMMVLVECGGRDDCDGGGGGWVVVDGGWHVLDVEHGIVGNVGRRLGRIVLRLADAVGRDTVGARDPL